MANLVIRCRKCGTGITAAVRSLRWIRCPRCHKPINLNAATIIDLANHPIMVRS